MYFPSGVKSRLLLCLPFKFHVFISKCRTWIHLFFRCSMYRGRQTSSHRGNRCVWRPRHSGLWRESREHGTGSECRRPVTPRYVRWYRGTFCKSKCQITWRFDDSLQGRIEYSLHYVQQLFSKDGPSSHGFSRERDYKYKLESGTQHCEVITVIREHCNRRIKHASSIQCGGNVRVYTVHVHQSIKYCNLGLWKTIRAKSVQKHSGTCQIPLPGMWFRNGQSW